MRENPSLASGLGHSLTLPIGGRANPVTVNGIVSRDPKSLQENMDREQQPITNVRMETSTEYKEGVHLSPSSFRKQKNSIFSSRHILSPGKSLSRIFSPRKININVISSPKRNQGQSRRPRSPAAIIRGYFARTGRVPSSDPKVGRYVSDSPREDHFVESSHKKELHRSEEPSRKACGDDVLSAHGLGELSACRGANEGTNTENDRRRETAGRQTRNSENNARKRLAKTTGQFVNALAKPPSKDTKPVESDDAKKSIISHFKSPRRMQANIRRKTCVDQVTNRRFTRPRVFRAKSMEGSTTHYLDSLSVQNDLRRNSVATFDSGALSSSGGPVGCHLERTVDGDAIDYSVRTDADIGSSNSASNSADIGNFGMASSVFADGKHRGPFHVDGRPRKYNFDFDVVMGWDNNGEENHQNGRDNCSEKLPPEPSPNDISRRPIHNTDHSGSTHVSSVLNADRPQGEARRFQDANHRVADHCTKDRNKMSVYGKIDVETTQNGRVDVNDLLEKGEYWHEARSINKKNQRVAPIIALPGKCRFPTPVTQVASVNRSRGAWK